MTFVTPDGNKPIVDETSVKIDDNGKPIYWGSKEEFQEALKVQKEIESKEFLSLKNLTEKDFSKYDAVYFSGGHGPMEKMIYNKDVARLLRHFNKNQKPTALVCHAPAVLYSTFSEGFIYKGYKLIAFTDAEENQTAVGPKMIVTPEKLLRKAGAHFIEGKSWSSHIVRDRELITGQNPSSSKEIALALLEEIL